MSNRKILSDSLNAISSPESGAGQELCNSQDGDQIDMFGQDLHHASHSPKPQKNDKGKTTNGISGPLFSSSSGSANLQLSLWSKLQHLLKSDGLMRSKRIWKQRTTPSGRLFSQLVVSGHYTEDQDCGLWENQNQNDFCWPTPSSRDWKGGYYGGRIRNGKLSIDTLDVAVQLIVKKDSGKNQKKSNAEMEKTESFQLNPNFTLWLMGYPPEWGQCAERVTASFRKRRRKS